MKQMPALILLSLLVLSACGGGGGSDSSPASPPSTGSTGGGGSTPAPTPEPVSRDFSVASLEIFQGRKIRTLQEDLLEAVEGRTTVVAVAVDYGVAEGEPLGTTPEIRAEILGAAEAVLADDLEALACIGAASHEDVSEADRECVYDVTDWYQEGNALRVHLDGRNLVEETDEGNNTASVGFGATEALETLSIVFLPLGLSGGEAPEVTEEIAQPWLEQVASMLPVEARIEMRIEEDMALPASYEQSSGGAIDFARNQLVARGDQTEYWYGVVSSPADDACGRGFVAGEGRGTSRAGSLNLGLAGCSSTTLAHEIGHNFSLEHPSNDPDFPHQEQSIGPDRAWNAVAGGFVRGPDVKDVMNFGIPGPRFISNYHYQKSLDWRLGHHRPMQSAPRSAIASTSGGGAPSSGPSLALTGGVDPWGNWSLDFAARTDLAPFAPLSNPSHWLVLLDAGSRELSRTGIALAQEAHTHTGEKVFATRIALPEGEAARVAIYDRDGALLLIEDLPVFSP